MDKGPALAALSALAHETRLDIVRMLVPRGDCGCPAGEIARGLDMSASALSFHLRHLEHAGLIHARRAGRQVIYAVDRARMGALIHHLLNDCCAADPEIRACCTGHGHGTVPDAHSSAGACSAATPGTSKI